MNPYFENFMRWKLESEKYEPVEDMEFVKDKDLNEKLATLLSNFWTLQWKAISDAVEKTSRQDKSGQTMQGLIDIETLLQNHVQPQNYFQFNSEK